jgi:hypothetical protein
MTPQELALISDAVKIGFPILGTMFGAIVGGVSAFIVTRQSNKNERRNLADIRKYELLTQACQGVVEFEHLVAMFTTAITNRVLDRVVQYDIEEARLNLAKQNSSLRLARAKLKLLGLADAELLLEEYIEASREVVRNGTNLSPQRASELNALISKGPVKFYDALSKHILVKD